MNNYYNYVTIPSLYNNAYCCQLIKINPPGNYKDVINVSTTLKLTIMANYFLNKGDLGTSHLVHYNSINKRN